MLLFSSFAKCSRNSIGNINKFVSRIINKSSIGNKDMINKSFNIYYQSFLSKVGAS
jgi:hypothetical protein